MGCSVSRSTEAPRSRVEIQDKEEASTGADMHDPKEKPSKSAVGFKAKYKLGREILGEGDFSIVKLARNRTTRQTVAVKIVNRSESPAENLASFQREVEIMRSLDHPHIIRCLDYFEEESFIYLVQEYMEGGELFDRIVKKMVYNEKEARDVIKILVDALKYCHDKNIIHCDLKPENLLLASKDDDADLKVVDFSNAIMNGNGKMSLTQSGTPGFVPPEILENKPYGYSVDMWSLGVLAYILLGGYPPFPDDNMRAMLVKIRKAEFEFHEEYWKHVSADAKDLIKKLLTVDVEQRLTADGVLQHPWLNHDDAVLEAINLNATLVEFKRFHATRKFKSAAKAVMAIHRMKHLSGIFDDTAFSSRRVATNESEGQENKTIEADGREAAAAGDDDESGNEESAAINHRVDFNRTSSQTDEAGISAAGPEEVTVELAA